MPVMCQFYIFLFADKAKLCKAIPQFANSALLQHDLDNLQICSLENHLDLYISKYVSLSIYCKYNTLFTVPLLNMYHY